MKKTILFTLFAASFAAQAASLQPAGSRDQSPTRIVDAPAVSADVERQALSFSWQLDPFAELQSVAPFAAESREYWMQIDASELTRGIDINTSAPGAVIRISPIGQASAVSAQRLSVSKNGTAISQPETFQRQAQADQLQAAGMAVSDRSIVVQLAEQHGEGRFRLQAAKASGRYVVHVFEPNSSTTLTAQAERAQALAGDTITVQSSLRDGDAAIRGTVMGAMLVAPDGRSFELPVSAGRIAARLPADAMTQPGLWEVQVFAEGNDGSARVQRDARTTIAVAAPTARFAGGYAFDRRTLKYQLPLQVGAEGRYEARGVLFATGPDGVARPVSQAHAAAWLGKGNGAIALAFDRSHVPLGYGAPFELRFLELNDQGRHGRLESRELAARDGERLQPRSGRAD